MSLERGAEIDGRQIGGLHGLRTWQVFLRALIWVYESWLAQGLILLFLFGPGDLSSSVAANG